MLYRFLGGVGTGRLFAGEGDAGRTEGAGGRGGDGAGAREVVIESVFRVDRTGGGVSWVDGVEVLLVVRRISVFCVHESW